MVFLVSHTMFVARVSPDPWGPTQVFYQHDGSSFPALPGCHSHLSYRNIEIVLADALPKGEPV